MFTTSLANKAKTLLNTQKDISMLKGLKQGFSDGYYGTVDRQLPMY